MTTGEQKIQIIRERFNDVCGAAGYQGSDHQRVYERAWGELEAAIELAAEGESEVLAALKQCRAALQSVVDRARKDLSSQLALDAAEAAIAKAEGGAQ